jgi:hypothetical protein
MKIEKALAIVGTVLLLAALANYVYGAIWTDNPKPPKSFPLRATWNKARLEEAIRNETFDANSFERYCQEKELTMTNGYLREFRCDINKDGVCGDANDVKLFNENKGQRAYITIADLARWEKEWNEKYPE